MPRSCFSVKALTNYYLRWIYKFKMILKLTVILVLVQFYKLEMHYKCT